MVFQATEMQINWHGIIRGTVRLQGVQKFDIVSFKRVGRFLVVPLEQDSKQRQLLKFNQFQQFSLVCRAWRLTWAQPIFLVDGEIKRVNNLTF